MKNDDKKYENKISNLDGLSINDFSKYIKNYINPNSVVLYKKGGKIHIKKKNRGKFTEYCGGKVTSECISKGKNSDDPKIRKRATFAENSRKWNK